MKVSELKEILGKCPDDAEIILCHELATNETGVEWIELENNGKVKLHEIPKYDLYSCRNAKEIKPY